MENIYEIIKCAHGESCLIKTGLSNTATYLKSFYVCSNGKCNFQKLATIQPLKCPVHPENFIGLFKPFMDVSSEEVKISYRCSMHGKAKKWCGSMMQPIINKNAIVEGQHSIQLKEPIIPNYNGIHRVEKMKIISDKKLVKNQLDNSGGVDEENPNKSVLNTNSFQAEYVDTSEYDVYLKKHSVSELQSDLAAQKHLLSSLNMKKLPDGGDKIRIIVEKMTKALECLQLENIDKSRDIGSDVSCGIHKESLKYPKKVQTYTGRCKPFLSALHLRDSKGDAISEAINRLHIQAKSCPPCTTEMDTPPGLTIDLMLHQKQALAWLMWREHQNPRGGILADDMGLGKTLTMISLIVKLKEKCNTDISQVSEWFDKSKFSNPRKSTLIVCPASLIHQWESEISRRVKPGHLTVFVYHGPNRKDNINKLLKADIVLTTYNIISLEVGTGNKKTSNDESCDTNVESKHSSSPILWIHWLRIILDEGHIIKNHRSVTALSMCRLKAEIRWILSGTPVHNDISDVYSLLRFLRCSPFDDFKLWRRQVDNKTKIGEGHLNLITKVLMLRRTKDQKCAITGISLVSLPEKECNIHYINLSKEERLIYENIFMKSRSKVQEYLKEQEKEKNKLMLRRTISGVDIGLEKVKQEVNNATQMLLMLLRLRQSCCHPYLMKEAAEVDDLKFELEIGIEEQIKSLSLECYPDVESHSTSPFMIENSSSKIKHLVETMEKVRLQCKVSGVSVKSVIVSQWTKMLDIVKHHLTMINYQCCTIKGDIPTAQRFKIIEDFNLDANGPEVMLLSLRAGGTGLNLIGGSHLYIIDMHWNPALEQQACDRIYRVGQKKNVFIHKFVCKETIEEKIVQLQQKKMTLANQVLTGIAGSVSTKFSLKDVRDLLGME